MFAQKSTCSPPPDDEGQHIGPYILARQIGHGGFSIVREAVSALSPNTLVAVKIVRKPKISTDEDIKAHFDHEISIHKSLSHPNILPLLQVFDTPYATFAILKLSRSGTLYDLAKQHRSGLRPSLAKHYSYQLASALRYLHITARVVHRDVKLENCLLDSGQLLLCDFGMAEFLDSEKPDVDRIAGGSFPYASPEQIRSSQPLLSPAFDIWSFGVVLFALLTGELPFNHVFLPRLQMLILKGDWDKDKIIHTDAAQVVCGCLVLDPENRWDINTVLRDPWYQLV
ncbi:CBL-interacting serine/threonine-protein kinase 11 [Neolecta irregularis DAH-3]|uniref:CBL-interacting serine/threonine-protein kinase 11 n=1 Tax=Neolecta irregularis (strain DAH-3) TaxID=1198029 RepID=A0A1U7LH92_NEOID|nr:CBL-interacting serine/threonine-protein kinase 11 [Neolecta irregularis DAH-3]|eukprot:OLL22025.1 CBL-interacting serine/threonine-protein kinase 11 [Neolecta irregularis DAH-3]